MCCATRTQREPSVLVEAHMGLIPRLVLPPYLHYVGGMLNQITPRERIASDREQSIRKAVLADDDEVLSELGPDASRARVGDLRHLVEECLRSRGTQDVHRC